MLLPNALRRKMSFSGVSFILTTGCLLMVSGFKECQWSKETAGVVSSCPLTKSEFEQRKKEKNCEKWAYVQNCTDPVNFLYHCVINEFGNAVVEVCSPRYKINGFCTEYNTVGARVQPNWNLECSQVTPPCDERYDSTDSYLYKGCFAVLKKNSSISSYNPPIKQSSFTIKIGLPLACAVLLIFVITSAIAYVRRKRQRGHNAHDRPGKHIDEGQRGHNAHDRPGKHIDEGQRGHNAHDRPGKHIDEENVTVPLMDKSDLTEVTLLKNTEDTKQFFCEPCSFENVKMQATTFCKSCEDPEPMCEDCAKQHTRSKSTRDHEICLNIDCFLNSEEGSKRRHKSEEKDIYDDKVPGAPNADDIKPDFVRLVWENPHSQVDHFQVRYKLKNGKSKWKTAETNAEENFAIIKRLMANTEYTFQVRGVFNDQEGPYGPTNDIKTKKSAATSMLDFGVLLDNSLNPAKYQLPLTENKDARNEEARTRQLILGKPSQDFCDEKTIMFVGATGSGKSTLVDGIINYIMGVSFEDPFRFTVVTLENDDKEKSSETEWITVYKIYPTKGCRLDYMLNIIDTPGFGDTREMQRNHDIVEQIRVLFSAPGEKGVLYIDAVCFIAKAPDARLTVVQKYIFQSIMSLFGKDVESNICTMITFDDGTKPPVVASLEESKLPFGQTFTFNNSALFAENRVNANSTLAPIFYEMGCKSFEFFFQYIRKLKTKSITKTFHDEREQLRTILSNVRPQVSAGLSKLSELQKQLDFFKKHKNEIEDDENFEYRVNETRQEKILLPRGEYATNCLECHVTCHKGCTLKDNKTNCIAMNSEGYCTVCIGKCFGEHHKYTPYIFRYVTAPVRKSYAEMKERYEKAIGKTLTKEEYIESLTHDVHGLFEIISYMMREMNRCITRLKEIALRPDPLSTVEYIDIMIMSQKRERQPGYYNRIKVLEEMKKTAFVDQDFDTLSKHLEDTKESTKSLMGRSFEKGPMRKKRGIFNVLNQLYNIENV